jgi:hypothetical protein
MESALALRRAWGEHLNQYQWSVFATLTNGWGASRERLSREFRRFTHRLQRQEKTNISWFYVIEGGSTMLSHIHALIYAPSLNTGVIASQWRVGLTHVRRYEQRLRVGHYMTKQILGTNEYDLSPTMPPFLARTTVLQTRSD